MHPFPPPANIHTIREYVCRLCTSQSCLRSVGLLYLGVTTRVASATIYSAMESGASPKKLDAVPTAHVGLRIGQIEGFRANERLYC